MQIVVVFLVILAGSCGRLAAGLKAGSWPEGLQYLLLYGILI